MFNRAAASAAAILAPFGVALAVPVVSQAADPPASQSGVDGQVVVTTDPNADPNSDPNNPDQADETSPEDGGDQQAPAPQPTPAPEQTAPAPTIAPAPAPAPPAAPQTLQQNNSNGGGSNGGGSNGGSGMGHSGKQHDTYERPARARLTVAASNIRTVSDTGAIPQGGVQAGGGGTALTAHEGSTSEGALGAAAGLVLLVTGTGLALRRRVGVQ